MYGRTSSRCSVPRPHPGPPSTTQTPGAHGEEADGRRGCRGRFGDDLSYFPELIVLGVDLQGQRACLYRTRIDDQVLPEFSVSALADAVVSRPTRRRWPPES